MTPNRYIDAGSFIRAHRKHLGISLRELGRRLSLSHAFISMVETGQCRLAPKHWDCLKRELPELDLQKLRDLYHLKDTTNVVVLLLGGRLFGVFSSMEAAQRASIRDTGTYTTAEFVRCVVDEVSHG